MLSGEETKCRRLGGSDSTQGYALASTAYQHAAIVVLWCQIIRRRRLRRRRFLHLRPWLLGGKSRHWFLYGCGGLVAVLLAIIATVLIMIWWSQRPIKPVVLSPQENSEVRSSAAPTCPDEGSGRLESKGVFEDATFVVGDDRSARESFIDLVLIGRFCRSRTEHAAPSKEGLAVAVGAIVSKFHVAGTLFAG
jgi:hypothetical protein